MSECGSPLCKICGHSHWSREPHILPANAPAEKRAKRPQIIATYTPPTPAPDKAKTPVVTLELIRSAAKKLNEANVPTFDRQFYDPLSNTVKRIPNTRREGRRVLKAEAARPDATRTAATAKPNPPAPPGSDLGALPGKQTNAEKVTPGKRKTAAKKKAKKKGIKRAKKTA